MPLVLTRATQRDARYSPAGSRAEHCARCRFFLPQGTCGRIIGPVSPQGWCRFFSQEMVQRSQPGSTLGTAGATASLDIGFYGPPLDPRLTFTRASTATYFDATGMMQTAATNAPRFDYDPVTHAALGLLIEEQRVNQAHPSILNASDWGFTASMTLGGSTTAPDGTTTTTSLIAATDTANTIRAMSAAFGFASSSTPCVCSAFMKASPVSNGYMQINSGGAAGMAYFNLTNGTAVVGADLAAGLTAKSVSIVPVGNGWYRCSFMFTTPAASTGVGPFFGPCTTVSATGDNRSAVGVIGQGVYVWGIQIEVGNFLTSYIPTTGAAVTRSTDVASIQPANMGWFVPPGGSWQIELIPFYFSSNYPRVIFLLPTTASTGPIIFDNLVPAHGGQYDGAILMTANTATLNAVTKIATTATAAIGRECMNGGAVASATNGGGYPTLGSSGVGFMCSSGVTPNSASGYFRRVRYWQRVLSDAEMQAVTT